MRKWGLWLGIGLALVGLMDAGYLTYEHYRDYIPPCEVQSILPVDCGLVLRSEYAVVMGIPLAVLGLLHYGLILVWLLAARRNKLFRYLALLESVVGVIASAYFVYLQLEIIRSICLYCMVSALISALLLITVWMSFRRERMVMVAKAFGWLYRNMVKKIFFKIDATIVHERMMKMGKRAAHLGKITGFFFNYKPESLKTVVSGIEFQGKIGLAAGFDYTASLVNTLNAWGFGFQTIGTITNHSYEGNPPPMLGRLPKSRSLLVNKGFKNEGVEVIINRLKGKTFPIPVGISIGRTNGQSLGQKESLVDIIEAFKKIEAAKLNLSYYELNISCPNLDGNVTFYEPSKLNELLAAIDKLKLSKPLWIKMPIEKSDKETVDMLEVIVKHSPAAVIFGNLQKNRQDPSIDQEEVAKSGKGNFSGKPTWERSNQLIELAAKKFGNKLVIVGCGGVFSAEDAKEKIRRGAKLVQLITGMIYQGPQLVNEINLNLTEDEK